MESEKGSRNPNFDTKPSNDVGKAVTEIDDLLANPPLLEYKPMSIDHIEALIRASIQQGNLDTSFVLVDPVETLINESNISPFSLVGDFVTNVSMHVINPFVVENLVAEPVMIAKVEEEKVVVT